MRFVERGEEGGADSEFCQVVPVNSFRRAASFDDVRKIRLLYAKAVGLSVGPQHQACADT